MASEGMSSSGLDSLLQIRNIGPASAEALVAAGVRDADHLREIGADEAYKMLLAAGRAPHFIGYYVLHMALQGRPWNDCRGAEKTALRDQFDALKAAHSAAAKKKGRDGAPDATLSDFFDQIGLIGD